MTNFIEQCRKGANWPALHRDVPQFDKGGRWAVTQEELAAFIGQVRSRSEDWLLERESLQQRIAALSDQKAAAVREAAESGIKLAAHESADRVKRTATGMGLEADKANRLAESVSK